MASCNECIHGYVCDSYWQGEGHMPNLCTQEDLPGYICENFKDKSRYIELPCKVGYYIWFLKNNNLSYNLSFGKINNFTIGNGNRLFADVYEIDEDDEIEGEFTLLLANQIGKTVFLTRKEAEKKLKEREDD